MRKSTVPVILFLFVFMFLGLGFVLSQQNGDEAKFQKVMDTYLDAYWKFYPTAATMAGYHKYDNQLEDLSEKNIDRHHEELDVFSQDMVTKADKTKLGANSQIDYDIMRNALDLELMRHENLLPWQYNPVFYNQLFLNSLQSLLTKEFAPLDARLKAATERAKALPDLVKQAKTNLQTPPQIYTETAIKQLPGILDFYRVEIPKLIEAAPAEAKSRFQAELTKAVAALEDYRSYLQTQLLPKSTGNFRLGEQAHSRLLTLTSEFSIPAQELVARAGADFKNLRREMFLVCIPFYRIMYPNINLEQLTTQRGEEEVRDIVIQGVFDKIKVEHSTKENFLENNKATVETLKSFFEQTKLIDLPDSALKIEAMPLACQGIGLTRLLTPGAYETGGTYTVELSPLPSDLTDNQVKEFLEEYNDFYAPFWTVRQIYPGSFVPAFFTNKSGSLMQKLYPNMPLYRGWPVYVEEMLISGGFGNYDLRQRLNQIKSQLKIVMDFQLELNIHQGGMTKEQAIQYMTKRGFQTPAEAELKWNRILLAPCESAYPYIGIQEIWDMEKDYKKLKGDAFSQREFLQTLLSYGAIPIRHLKAKLAQ
jgi:Bacterial protein of unknown function (DUF885)